MKFNRGETVICSCTVKNSSGTLVDPSTSMKITIKDLLNTVMVNDQSMTKDSAGTYHYDWGTSASIGKGIYSVYYKATDSTRISLVKDSVELE